MSAPNDCTARNYPPSIRNDTKTSPSTHRRLPSRDPQPHTMQSLKTNQFSAHYIAWNPKPRPDSRRRLPDPAPTSSHQLQKGRPSFLQPMPTCHGNLRAPHELETDTRLPTYADENPFVRRAPGKEAVTIDGSTSAASFPHPRRRHVLATHATTAFTSTHPRRSQPRPTHMPGPAKPRYDFPSKLTLRWGPPDGQNPRASACQQTLPGPHARRPNDPLAKGNSCPRRKLLYDVSRPYVHFPDP